nr:NTP transferase domain-containing protein [Candidatus Poribacteria bacterium]
MSKDEKTKIVAVIPAHLNSIRFPNKILHPFHNLPMIEHVRRRALLCDTISKVLVATCDEEIADQVRKHGGKVIMTSNKHLTGTTRVAEAIEQIDCTHVLILQGDEPLLLPHHLDLITSHLVAEPDEDAWNVTGPINKSDELDIHSFVKCAITKEHRILYCFRRSPSYSDTDQ